MKEYLTVDERNDLALIKYHQKRKEMDRQRRAAMRRMSERYKADRIAALQDRQQANRVQAQVSSFLRNVALRWMANAQARGDDVSYTSAVTTLRWEDLCINP